MAPLPLPLPAPPLAATAGFSSSQAISVLESQSQTPALATPHSSPLGAPTGLPFNPDDDLIDYEDDTTIQPTPNAIAASLPLPPSPSPTHRSDSTTSSSHLGDDSRDIEMDDGQGFIVPDNQLIIVPNSQHPSDAATLSQEVAGLGPTSSSPVDRFLNRPAQGAYAEDLNDDEYEDNGDDLDTSDGSSDHQSTAPPSPRATSPAPDVEASQTSPADSTGIEAISFFAADPKANHPRCDGLAIRAAAQPYGGVPVGACRYFMPHWWKQSNDAHLQWAEDAFDTALSRRFSTVARPREFSVFFHNQGNEARQKAVDVYAAHSGLHLSMVDTSLVLPGNDSTPEVTLSAPKAGLVISPRYVPARARFTAKTTRDEAKAAFLDTFGRSRACFVVEAWEVVRRHQFKNEIVVLLMVPPPPPGPRAPNAPPYTGMAEPVSDRQRESIPGFVCHPGSEGAQLDFAHRPKHCWGCKGFSTYFHRTEMCVNAAMPCGLCQKRDHTGISCPRKTATASLGLLNPRPSAPALPTQFSFPQVPAVPGPAPATPGPLTTASSSTSGIPPSSATTTTPPNGPFTFLYGSMVHGAPRSGPTPAATPTPSTPRGSKRPSPSDAPGPTPAPTRSPTKKSSSSSNTKGKKKSDGLFQTALSFYRPGTATAPGTTLPSSTEASSSRATLPPAPSPSSSAKRTRIVR